MEDQADSAMVSKVLELMSGSDSKLVGVKRSNNDFEQRHDVSPKRVKMRDLGSVIRSEEINAHNSKSLKGKECSQQLQFSGEGVSQVTEVPVTISQVETTKGEKLLAESNCVTSKGIGLDLNVEDVSSSLNHESVHHKHVNNLKSKDVSECGSYIGPVKEKDSLRIWKEMKQNGFLSSSHGGISMQNGLLSPYHGGIAMQNGLLSSSHGGIPVPKQRGRKSKNDVFKKKMELAKKEQVDRFTKIAAPSGLLNGLNPGIINHVRNRKQVHSIIEALVKSEKLEILHSESKQASHVKSGTKDDDGKKDNGNMDDSALHQSGCYHEDGPPNATSISKKAGGYLVPMNKGFSSISEEISGDGDSGMVDPLSEDDALMLKLSSSTKASENASSLFNEESTNFASASSLSVKAATVASQWLELLQQDIKGRLSALRRSKKKVRAVITTELPFLISKEFSSNQGSDPNITRSSADGFSHDATAEMHRVRWSALFDQMDKALSEEEKQLESWLNQIKGMQLHCDQGLQHMHWNVLYGLPQLGAAENDIRSGMGDSFDRELAVRAAAASIYSTCNFMLSKENAPCSLI
ncbi:uncharacterized protein LOC111309680 isoform X2 [Durio zibethinus]|uniref:Uncharacterized protein LOC111309680 isoform X2 n=1 Tax=Durio zibethinus TaxID=66656 RepID=A0A6P6AHR3_DURZI|nr:uncharacterized protein LOC111309680 isoform X2 [Durio zibethinus]